MDPLAYLTATEPDHGRISEMVVYIRESSKYSWPCSVAILLIDANDGVLASVVLTPTEIICSSKPSVVFSPLGLLTELTFVLL